MSKNKKKKNIAQKIHFLAKLLTVLSVLGFLILGTLCLIAALTSDMDETIQTAGFQAAGICYVMAALSPLLSSLIHGFAALLEATEAQAQDTREIKEMLRRGLAEGSLSDDISRKLVQNLAKLQAKAASTMTGQAPAQRPAHYAPMQRPATPAPQPPAASYAPPAPQAASAQPTPVAAVAPAAESAPAVEDTPVVKSAPTVEAAPKQATPVASAAPVRPAVSPTPATPVFGAQPLKPIADDEETF